MIPYDHKQTEEQNVARLHLYHAKIVRDLEDKRNLITDDPTPGVAGTRLAEVDQQLASARLLAEASANGVLLHDPRSISGCHPEMTKWRAKLAPLGLVVRPDQFMASIHAADEEKASPLTVIKGNPNGAHNLGSPTMSVR
jgi:hypothetical protein